MAYNDFEFEVRESIAFLFSFLFIFDDIDVNVMYISLLDRIHCIKDTLYFFFLHDYIVNDKLILF